LLKARLSNVVEWKAILNAISDVVEDAMFIVNDDGISFRGMDSAHIALLDVTFPKSSFDELEGKTSFFGVKIADFKNLLNTASNNDKIEFRIDNNQVMKISILGQINMEYNLRLIQKEGVNTPIPKIDYKVKLSVEPDTITRILSNILNIAEYVDIECSKEIVEFSGKGDIGDARISLEKGKPELKELMTSEESKASYSLEYMAKIIRDIGKATKTINMEFASKNPIHLLFEMPSMARVEYYLAPRVEN